ncbi:MAG: hypothetical protein R2751_08345 [Bacteroidales bacterium]
MSTPVLLPDTTDFASGATDGTWMQWLTPEEGEVLEAGRKAIRLVAGSNPILLEAVPYNRCGSAESSSPRSFHAWPRRVAAMGATPSFVPAPKAIWKSTPSRATYVWELPDLWTGRSDGFRLLPAHGGNRGPCESAQCLR